MEGLRFVCYRHENPVASLLAFYRFSRVGAVVPDPMSLGHVVLFTGPTTMSETVPSTLEAPDQRLTIIGAPHPHQLIIPNITKSSGHDDVLRGAFLALLVCLKRAAYARLALTPT